MSFHFIFFTSFLNNTLQYEMNYKVILKYENMEQSK
jgi:hypothetical protein